MSENTEIEYLKLKVKEWEQLYKESDARASKFARKCGILEVRLELAEYRLEVARRAYAQLTGEYNPEWPKLSRWETVQVYKDNPEYALPIPAMEEEKHVDNDIYALFKQSSNRI